MQQPVFFKRRSHAGFTAKAAPCHALQGGAGMVLA
jgi:hypothetical protein